MLGFTNSLFAASSQWGAKFLQCPHHGAQNLTRNYLSESRIIYLKFFPTPILTGSSFVQGIGADLRNCQTQPALTLERKAERESFVAYPSKAYLSCFYPKYRILGVLLVSTPKYSASLSKSPCPSLAQETVKITSVYPASSRALNASLAAVDASLSAPNKNRADFLAWKIFSMAELSKGTTSLLTIKKRQTSAKITFIFIISNTCNIVLYILSLIEVLMLKNYLIYILIYQNLIFYMHRFDKLDYTGRILLYQLIEISNLNLFRNCYHIRKQLNQQFLQLFKHFNNYLFSFLRVQVASPLISCVLQYQNCAVHQLLNNIITINLQQYIKMNQKIVGVNQDARYKLILVGDVNVGKTALFWRYTEGDFLANKDTLVTAIDFKMKTITIDSKPIKLYIWDTAGSQKYRSIVSTYFKGCQGVVIVFDLSRQSSFKNAIEHWYPLAKSKTLDTVFILVGNKSDLDIRVPRDEVQQWCSNNHIHYIQTSVKLNKNVTEVFDWIARRICEQQNSFTKSKSFALESKQISNNKKQKQKKCCKS